MGNKPTFNEINNIFEQHKDSLANARGTKVVFSDLNSLGAIYDPKA